MGLDRCPAAPVGVLAEWGKVTTQNQENRKRTTCKWASHGREPVPPAFGRSHSRIIIDKRLQDVLDTPGDQRRFLFVSNRIPSNTSAPEKATTQTATKTDDHACQGTDRPQKYAAAQRGGGGAGVNTRPIALT
jgi:hypothetical protein